MRFMTDTWLVFSRAMRLSLRNPVWVILGLLQPILYLTLFGPLLEPVANAPGFPPGTAWQVFVPGLLVQLAVFGAAFAGFGLIAEWRAGVVERMRVTPASRGALLLGRVLRDVVVIVVQGAMLSLVAVVFFGLEAPMGSLIAGVAIVALLGGAFSALSYGTALKLKSEDSFAPVINGLLLPILLLSGILLPMALAPGWLQTVADVNPLTHVVDGVRALYIDDLASNEVVIGSAVTVGLLLVGVLYGSWVFRKESA
ncbi:MAG TPA: ABC transporter permease [Acidimicrobiia bacterium]|nr:ABC transporter permease [Acidimicrobiia bacterium]